MFCKHCGKQLTPSDLFCPTCGTKNDFKQEDSWEVTQANLADVQTTSKSAPNPEPIQSSEPMPRKQKILLSWLPICGLALSALGILIFFAIIIAGLIGWGRVFLFGGYAATKVFTIISIIFMLLGAGILTAKLIFANVKNCGGFPAKAVTKIISLVLILLSLAFCLWGFIDAGKNTNSHSGLGNSGNNLYSAYNSAGCSSPWATYNTSYIKIDTNPYDIDGGSTTYLTRATAAIKSINSYFNVPSYVYDDMLSTRALDGRQTYENNKISIYWRYHPDSGLEVTYSLP